MRSGEVTLDFDHCGQVKVGKHQMYPHNAAGSMRFQV